MIALCAGVAAGLGSGSAGLGVAVFIVVGSIGRFGLPEVAWTPLFGLGALAVSGAVVAGAPLERVLPIFLVGLLLHFRHRDPQRALVNLILALLLVVAGVQSESPWFVLGLGSWIGVLVSRPGRGILAIPLLAISALLFLTLPRFGSFDLLESGDALTGFDDDVELGELSDLLDDPARVFTATFSEAPQGTVYFRGVALDRFDGRRWWSEAEGIREPDYKGALPDTIRVRVELDAHAEGVLFVPGTVDGLDTDGLAVDRDTAGAYHLPGPARSVDYTAFVRPPYGPGRGDPFLDAEPRTDLPDGFTPRMKALFIEAVQDAATPREKMDALTGWLRSSYAYTRAPRDADPEAPLDHFLHTGKEGHCEYFASALAVGGRTLGIPTRVVNGFVGGEPQGPKTLVLRRYHAHSWVEYFDGDQWVLADATPTLGAPGSPGLPWRALEVAEDAWDDLLGFDGDRQLHSAAGLATAFVPAAPASSRPLIGAALIGLMAGLGALLARRLGRPTTQHRIASGDPITRELRRVLDRAQGPASAGTSDLSRVEALTAMVPEVGAPLQELAWLSYQVRFGGVGPGEGLARAKTLAAQVELQLP